VPISGTLTASGGGAPERVRATSEPGLVAIPAGSILVEGSSDSHLKLTVFAPTNAAFANLPKATLEKVRNDKKLLTSIAANVDLRRRSDAAWVGARSRPRATR